jgi:spore germination protein GerM
MNRPLVIGALLFAVIFSAIVILVKHRPSAPAEKPAAGAVQNEKTSRVNTIQRKINVKLFFIDPGSAMLVAQDRSIAYRESLPGEAREILTELVKGPDDTDHLVPPLPAGTVLRDVFITKDGIAYADFSQDLIDHHQGGSLGELNTVFAVINTLTLNLPQIKKVQILVNDQVVETLKGHVDLSRPLGQDLSIVQAGARPQVTQAQTQKAQS